MRGKKTAESLARSFKKSKGTKEAYLKTVNDAIDKAAKEGGWRPSEAAMAKADKQRIADTVWGRP